MLQRNVRYFITNEHKFEVNRSIIFFLFHFLLISNIRNRYFVKFQLKRNSSASYSLTISIWYLCGRFKIAQFSNEEMEFERVRAEVSRCYLNFYLNLFNKIFILNVLKSRLWLLWWRAHWALPFERCFYAFNIFQFKAQKWGKHFLAIVPIFPINLDTLLHGVRVKSVMEIPFQKNNNFKWRE